jgi:hypothetical protein
MYSLTLACWATAFVGTGILTSIPGTFFLLTQMGVLVSVRNQGAVPEAVTGSTEDLADLEVEADPDAVLVEDSRIVPGRAAAAPHVSRFS